MVDFNRPLGKKAAKIDMRVPALWMHTTDAPRPPEAVDWSSKVSVWGAMANNSIGDCTAAGAAHAIQSWTANTGSEITLSDAEVINFYSATTGYIPGRPDTDQGAAELDVLKYWHAHGFNGHTLDAFATIRLDEDDLKDAIWLCGGAYLGLELPLSAQRQDVWDVAEGGTVSPANKAGSWGGHAVFATSYNQDGITVVSWGKLQKLTWEFFNVYCSEAYALLSKDWLLSTGSAPSGFDYSGLETAMSQISNQPIMASPQHMAQDEIPAAPAPVVPPTLAPVQPTEQYDHGVIVNTTDSTMHSVIILAGVALSVMAGLGWIKPEAIPHDMEAVKVVLGAAAAFAAWYVQTRREQGANVNTLVKLGMPVPPRRPKFLGVF